MPRYFRTGAALASAALLATTMAGPAAAQNSIPGDNNPGTTVIDGSTLATVTVADAAADATSVTGTFANTSDKTLTCAGPAGTSPHGGLVSEATVAKAMFDYYATRAHKADPVLDVDFFSIPFVGTIGVNADLAGILKLLPSGSGAQLFGEAYAQRQAINDAFQAAKQVGHQGTVTKFTVNAGDTHPWTANLNRPSAGARTDFQAGAFFVCTDPAKTIYRFAGYEGGTAPTDGITPESGLVGSLDSSSLGDAVGSLMGGGSANGNSTGGIGGNGGS